MRTRAQIKKDAKAQLYGKKGTAALMVLLMFVIAIIPRIICTFVESEGIAIIIAIAGQIYVSLLGIGFTLFYLAVRRNQSVSVGMLFSGSEYYLKGFAITVLMEIITVVGTILFVIPGIIFSLMYSQALYIYVENPEMGVIECLRTSRLAMKGHKGELFILNLSFFGWVILCALTLGIAALYVSPYFGTTLINFYTDLMEEYRGKQIEM